MILASQVLFYTGCGCAALAGFILLSLAYVGLI